MFPSRVPILFVGFGFSQLLWPPAGPLGFYGVARPCGPCEYRLRNRELRALCNVCNLTLNEAPALAMFPVFRRFASQHSSGLVYHSDRGCGSEEFLFPRMAETTIMICRCHFHISTLAAPRLLWSPFESIHGWVSVSKLILGEPRRGGHCSMTLYYTTVLERI